MLGRLEHLVGEIADTNSKLILLVGPNQSENLMLLSRLGAKLSIRPCHLGLELGKRLAGAAKNTRSLLASQLLREIAEIEHTEDPLLLDGLELLFEPSLHISPLDAIKRLAHSKRVVAVWPGVFVNDRLIYAEMSHPEHRNYSRDGVVIFEI